MLYVFTGDGKGKTSAAIGTLVRASGAGKSCAIVFFDKNPDYCNELKVLQGLGIEAHIFGQNRMHDSAFRLTNDKKDIEGVESAFKKAQELIETSEVLILDEFLNCLRTDQLKLEIALNFIDNFPKDKFLILTGRGLPREIEERADLISEIKKIKHPFDKKIPAQEGIDY